MAVIIVNVLRTTGHVNSDTNLAIYKLLFRFERAHPPSPKGMSTTESVYIMRYDKKKKTFIAKFGS